MALICHGPKNRSIQWLIQMQYKHSHCQSSTQVISLNDSNYYYFTAPEDAPLCEVYNFSVTATYVGATYTGAGCSIPSPVLSRMLPSLPNVDELESSLSYSLIPLRNTRKGG